MAALRHVAVDSGGVLKWVLPEAGCSKALALLDEHEAGQTGFDRSRFAYGGVRQRTLQALQARRFDGSGRSDGFPATRSPLALVGRRASAIACHL